MSDDTKWWEPDPLGWMYWPAGLPRVLNIPMILKMFESFGFEHCASDTLESDYEKVAIYTDGKLFKHVARQLPDGQWTSKLGEADDITHNSLSVIAGQLYGHASHFLKRRLPTTSST